MSWDLDPLVVAPLVVTGALYAIGVARVWRRAGPGRGVSRWSAASFASGWVVMAVALVTPIATIAENVLSVHMTQHVLLMLVAAPLLTFGHPLLACFWAFSATSRDRLAKRWLAPFAGKGASHLIWRGVTAPASAFVIQAVALWLWHIPAWYEAALRHDSIHALEHLSFVVTACLFWWAMVRGRYGRMGYGLSVLYVFLTAVHSSALGALLTVAPTVWYDDYAQRAAALHVDALADQQLAGLLMWIPASVVFIVLGLALFAAWLGEAERRAGFGVTDAASRRFIEARTDAQ
jgi:putative membrane protein